MPLIPDGDYTATVVEIEQTLVSLELSPEQGPKNDLYNLVVGMEELPSPARHVDAILYVMIHGDKLVDATYAPEDTETRTDAAQDRFDRLSKRPPNSDADSDQNDSSE